MAKIVVCASGDDGTHSNNSLLCNRNKGHKGRHKNRGHSWSDKEDVKPEPIYVTMLAKCYLAAPENSEEEELLGRVLTLACERAGCDACAVVREG